MTAPAALARESIGFLSPGRVWHPLRVRCVSLRYPGVSRGSTPGYSRPTRWVGAAGSPEGCVIAAGGRSQAKTAGSRFRPVMHPGEMPDLSVAMGIARGLDGCAGRTDAGRHRIIAVKA
jgi:hypothetical protein